MTWVQRLNENKGGEIEALASLLLAGMRKFFPPNTES